MQQYLDLMRHVRDKGVFKQGRTDAGTYIVFLAIKCDLIYLKVFLREVTTKKLHLKSIIHELLWFYLAAPILLILKIMAFQYGMNGQTKLVILVQFMVINGDLGLVLMESILIQIQIINR